MEGHSNSQYGDVSFSPDGSMLISSGGWRNDGTIRLYDVKIGELVEVLESSAKGVLGISISPNGNIIASSSLDGIIQLWGIDN
jgi:WD40 repeat protein